MASRPGSVAGVLLSENAKCTNGHALEPKIVAGSFMALVDKQCRMCHRGLHAGQTRWSCKGCNFHLCDSCLTTWCSSQPSKAKAPVAAVGGHAAAMFVELPQCKWGRACYNHDPEHRKRFARSSVVLWLRVLSGCMITDALGTGPPTLYTHSATARRSPTLARS
eukprot:s2339_g4.t1